MAAHPAVSNCALVTLLLHNAASPTPPLFGGGEMRALPAQFLDSFPRIEVGPINERKVGDLARVVGTIRNVDLLAGDMDRADPAFVLQQPDVGQWREIERDKIGGAARFEDANAIAFGHKPGIDFGRRAQCGGRSEPQVLDKELELAGIPFAIRGYRKAGVPLLTGTDTGFAVTPYGEWNARELELFVEDLGFTPAAALRVATEVNARFMTEGGRIGSLEPGRAADFIALDGSPLADIRVLQDKSRLRAVYIAGKEIRILDRPYDPRQVTDFALSNWTDLYTQARVGELRRQAVPQLAAAE